jgi:Protein of unknown function (DUF3467)
MPEATAPDWIFGCSMHFTFLGCEVQEHRSTKRAFYWYIALMYDWTIEPAPVCRDAAAKALNSTPGMRGRASATLDPGFSPQPQTRYTGILMANPTQPNVKLTNTPDYRESYANSVQIRVNVWDFFLVFGTLTQQSETQVEIQNFQGIYLSPQQAKALLGVLQQNVTGYENAFGEIKLDPRMMPHGPVH